MDGQQQFDFFLSQERCAEIPYLAPLRFPENKRFLFSYRLLLDWGHIIGDY